jgi:hypothetical protein
MAAAARTTRKAIQTLLRNKLGVLSASSVDDGGKMGSRSEAVLMWLSLVMANIGNVTSLDFSHHHIACWRLRSVS